MITENIVAEVKEAKYFSVISDEVEDAAAVEQISLVVRYVHKEENNHQYTGDYFVKESFVGFKEQHRQMTGDAIASTILKKMEELGLNCVYLWAQGYDGSGSMAGKRKGVSSIILQKYPLATYIHCCNHILNLSIASSCSQVLVRNMMGSVSQMSKFFQHSKRHDKLLEVIECELPEVKKKRVKPFVGPDGLRDTMQYKCLLIFTLPLCKLCMTLHMVKILSHGIQKLSMMQTAYLLL